MSAQFDERIWYLPFCNNEEISRILAPQSPKDILLRERANIVADHMRFLRVYRNKANLTDKWSFENSFRTEHYTEFIKYLPDDLANSCKTIEYGDMFSDEVNGYAYIDKQWGKFISLNEALQFYMKFCNLAVMNFDIDIPMKIRFNALRIAIRVLLKNEAMDFFMDPRGIIPSHVAKKILHPIRYELQYIAGHEFSHHILGHFSDNDTSERIFLNLEDRQYVKTMFNTSQQQEIEADIKSITLPIYNEEIYKEIYSASLLWFLTLQLGETAKDFIIPSLSHVQTHPTAEDRVKNVFENIRKPKDFDLDYLTKLEQRIKILKELLIEDLSVNFDFYEIYGSAYLDEPNTEWRGKELIDRVDYY